MPKPVPPSLLLTLVPITLVPMTFVVLWSTGFVVARLSAGHVAPVWFLTLRFPVAGLFMMALAFVQRAPWPDARHALHAIVAGAFLHAGYLAPIYWAVANGLPAGVSALIVGLQPLITSFMAALFLGVKISGRHWLGLLLGLAGIALVIAPKLVFATLGGITPLTVALAAAGAMSISAGTVYQKKFATGLALASGGAWQYCGATIVTLVISLFLGDFQFDYSAAAWLALAWAIFVLSILAILLLTMMIRNGNMAKVSSLIYLVPAVSSLMTFFLFDERLNLVQISGMALCATAVFVVNAVSTRRPAP